MSNALLNEMNKIDKKEKKSRVKSIRPSNRISRMQTKIELEEKTMDNRGWFARAMDKISGVDY